VSELSEIEAFASLSEDQITALEKHVAQTTKLSVRLTSRKAFLSTLLLVSGVTTVALFLYGVAGELGISLPELLSLSFEPVLIGATMAFCPSIATVILFLGLQDLNKENSHG
jgi:hypothetical protein